MKNKKGLVIFIAFLAVLVGAVAFYVIKLGFKYNEKGATGNTNGNLLNEGLFCEYDGEVYFANPADNDALYKMNMDGTEFEKLNSDQVSYINIQNGYAYYKKFNKDSMENALFGRFLFAIMRTELDSGTSKMLHNGKIDCMTLVGNYIYYRYYDDETLFSLRKVKIDGEEDKLITKVDYQPITSYKEKIYFTDVEGTHNLMCLDTKDDSISIAIKGNIYLPDIYGGDLYYIDLDNDRKLTKINLDSKEKTILSEEKVVNYNLSGKYDVIFYQVENDVVDHKLCRMTASGENKQTVKVGDYCKIGITEKYTYFYQTVQGEDEALFRTPTKGVIDVEMFEAPVIEDEL